MHLIVDVSATARENIWMGMKIAFDDESFGYFEQTAQFLSE